MKSMNSDRAVAACGWRVAELKLLHLHLVELFAVVFRAIEKTTFGLRSCLKSLLQSFQRPQRKRLRL